MLSEHLPKAKFRGTAQTLRTSFRSFLACFLLRTHLALSASILANLGVMIGRLSTSSHPELITLVPISLVDGEPLEGAGGAKQLWEV